VTAVAINERVTPTHSAADLKNKITPPDVVSIKGKDLKVITGMHSDDQFFIRPEVQRREPARIKVPSIGGMSPIYIRWIVQGAAPYIVRVKSIKGGIDQAVSK
jgi:hypothetical protein